MNTTSRVLITAILCVTAAACSKKVKENTDTGATVGNDTTSSGTTSSGMGNTGPVSAGAYGPGDLDTDACLRQRVVYFDFDQDALKPEFAAIVSCHSKYLRDRPSARITLEGNADERGTREYNMGLGERRGNAVYSALQAAGANSSQLTVVSYGEERPLCTESSESCWAQNRRVEIVYSAR